MLSASNEDEDKSYEKGDKAVRLTTEAPYKTLNFKSKPVDEALAPSDAKVGIFCGIGFPTFLVNALKPFNSLRETIQILKIEMRWKKAVRDSPIDERVFENFTWLLGQMRYSRSSIPFYWFKRDFFLEILVSHLWYETMLASFSCPSKGITVSATNRNLQSSSLRVLQIIFISVLL